MTNLLYLNIAYNYLTGAPVGFQDSNHSLPHQLITYNVSNNLLTGPWPDLKYLTSLQYLDLSSNSLSSTLPSTYGDLTRLTFFYAQNNTKPTGSLPIALSKLSLLEVLVLTNNNFTGPIYKNLPSPNLTTLDISGNAFTGRACRYSYFSHFVVVFCSLSSLPFFLFLKVPYRRGCFKSTLGYSVLSWERIVSREVCLWKCVQQPN